MQNKTKQRRKEGTSNYAETHEPPRDARVKSICNTFVNPRVYARVTPLPGGQLPNESTAVIICPHLEKMKGRSWLLCEAHKGVKRDAKSGTTMSKG
ncbi:hypothetical protein K0M31_004567 [Melipona bicolor]|uniref:Uncharacterized protein n=1 Tax=Melipona bicolor TaxID=60889 RepID=A0AA40KNQ7_9HYME|nr:hypothetical protein K0M31_004567 [Melipona bicolor]